MIVSFRCDHPPKSPSNAKVAATITVSDLYKEAHKQLGIDAGYIMRCLIFGRDSILLQPHDTRVILALVSRLLRMHCSLMVLCCWCWIHVGVYDT
jgi:hypothetical protein